LTLLESVLALAILGLTATGVLGSYQGAIRATRASSDWTTAIAYAESAMESTKTGPVLHPVSVALPDGYREEITTSTIAGSGLKKVRVRIIFPDGREYVVERIASP